MSSRAPGTRDMDDVCIFDWDGTSLGSYVPSFRRRCGRRADNGDTLPEAQGGCPFGTSTTSGAWGRSGPAPFGTFGV